MDFSFIEDEQVRKQAEEQFKSTLEEKINQEVDGLKRKNEELLNEKKMTQKQFEEFKSQYNDIDVEKAKEAMALLNDSKKKQLLEDNKLDEYIQAEIQSRTSDIEKKYQKEKEEIELQTNSFAEKATKYEQLFKNKMVDDELTNVALKLGIKNDAIEDFVEIGRKQFKYDESEGKATAKDENGNYIKTDDGKFLTPSEWGEQQKTRRSYWFPESYGMNASGSSVSNDITNDIYQKMDEASRKNDQKEFRRLMGLLKK